MITQEGKAAFRGFRIWRRFAHPTGDGSLGKVEAEHEQLSVNPRCSSGWIFAIQSFSCPLKHQFGSNGILASESMYFNSLFGAAHEPLSDHIDPVDRLRVIPHAGSGSIFRAVRVCHPRALGVKDLLIRSGKGHA